MKTELTSLDQALLIVAGEFEELNTVYDGDAVFDVIPKKPDLALLLKTLREHNFAYEIYNLDNKKVRVSINIGRILPNRIRVVADDEVTAMYIATAKAILAAKGNRFRCVLCGEEATPYPHMPPSDICGRCLENQHSVERGSND